MRRATTFVLAAAVSLWVPSTAAAQGPVVEPIAELTRVQTLSFGFGTVILVGATLLAMAPNWGERAVGTARRSAFFSLLVGLPGVALLAFLGWAGAYLTETVIWAALGIPMTAVAIVSAVVAGTVGLVAVGTVLGSPFGEGNPWRGVPLGAILGAALYVVPYAGPVVLVLLATLGAGAALRATFGGDRLEARERAVPPANQV